MRSRKREIGKFVTDVLLPVGLMETKRESQAKEDSQELYSSNPEKTYHDEN